MFMTTGDSLLLGHHVYTYEPSHVYIYIYTHTHTNIHTYIYMYLCVSVYIENTRVNSGIFNLASHGSFYYSFYD